MVTVLHAGDGTTLLGAVETWLHCKATRYGMRAAVGEAAALAAERAPAATGVFSARQPVAGRLRAWDRRDQQLRVGMLRSRHYPLDCASFGEMCSVKDKDRVTDLVGGGEVMGDVEDRDAVLLGQLT